MIFPVTQKAFNSHFLRGKENEKITTLSHVASFGTVLHCVALHNEVKKMADSHSTLLPPAHQSLNTK